MTPAPTLPLVRDLHGREIHPGDLLRSFHFKDGRRRTWWLYHVVVKRGTDLVAVPTTELGTGRKDGGRVTLGSKAWAADFCEWRGHGLGFEVIHGNGWDDRPKKARPEWDEEVMGAAAATPAG